MARRVVRLFVSLLSMVGTAAAKADGRSLDAYPYALCLDGSPGRYYIREGSGDGTAKFVIFLEGGGFCGSHSDCASRATGYLGSTKSDAPQIDLNHPFASISETENPLLWNWNHVFVRYCDGAYLSGNRADPVDADGMRLHYRGQAIMEAILLDLTAQNSLAQASDVVFSGCSAGGISTFAHLDAFAARLPSKMTRVSGLPDSGFYLDLPIFTPLKHFVVDENGQNGTGLLDPTCLHENPSVAERCLIGAVVSPYLATALFAWQSSYDTDQRGCEMTKACSKSSKCVEAYGANLTSELSRALLSNPKHGAFLDSCSRHCQGPALPHDDASGLVPMQAFAQWYEGGVRSYGQAAKYPCGSCCETALV